MVKSKVARVFKYAFLTVAAFLSVFPLYWMIVSATNINRDILRGSLIPGTNFLINLQNLLDQAPLGQAFWNSTRNALSVAVVSVIICSLAGYGFEIFHSKAKDRFMAFLLVSVMVPFAATMIPLFSLVANLGLMNTTLGFMLPMLSSAFLIMLFRQSARAFPNEMIEAARVDGLSELSIFVRMFMPTMKATYAAAFTIQFLASWNTFLWPRLIMTPGFDSITMPMLIANLLQGYVMDYGVNMMAVLVASVPTIIIFFILQRQFAEGIVGAVK